MAKNRPYQGCKIRVKMSYPEMADYQEAQQQIQRGIEFIWLIAREEEDRLRQLFAQNAEGKRAQVEALHA